MKRKLLLFTILFTIFSISVFSQQTDIINMDELLEKARRGQLSGYSPDELRSRIAQSGMSEEQAIQYARERNIDLEQYLKQESAARATIEPEKEKVAEMQALRRQIPQKSKYSSVPAFKGRGSAANMPPFGFDLFSLPPNTFEPVVNVPTPANYQVGPGDEIIVNVWGQTQLTYQLTIARDGYVVIPNVGKVQIEGLTIQHVKQKLIQQMSQVYEGLANGKSDANTFLDVSLGKLKTIQVFVVGEAAQPGGYVLSGLSGAFTALYYAGGPNVNGSLRHLQIKRDDKTIATADFYEFALYGKKSGDVRLQDGDILFIPQAGKRVAIEGSIFKSAIYELKPEESLNNLIKMSGGLTFDAYTKRIHIERVIPFNQRNMFERDLLDIDIQFNSMDEILTNSYKLEDGDAVSIFSINQERENLVTISGNVWKPGRYAITPNMTVKDLIQKADGLKEDTFLERAVLMRVRQEDLKKEVIPFNLTLALTGDEQNNLKLQRLDVVSIYDEDFFKPKHPVTIHGAVRKPGTYHRAENMTVADLIIMAGGVQTGADLSRIDVARLDTTSEKNISKLIIASLPEDYWTTERSKDVELVDYDVISVRMKPQFKPTKTVTVRGEVEYPGIYAIQYEGERLSSLIKRFGGFKTTAYLEGVRFQRSTSVGGVNTGNIAGIVQSAIDSLGRPMPIPQRLASEDVPIDITRVLKDPDSRSNLELEEGDEIIVPRDPGVVYVQGQVNLPSSVPYQKGASLKYYLKQAGGITPYGDDENIVVVLPNRNKWESSGFFLLPDPEILSGTTITVPFKLKETDTTLQTLREWATISLSTATIGILIWQVVK